MNLEALRDLGKFGLPTEPEQFSGNHGTHSLVSQSLLENFASDPCPSVFHPWLKTERFT